MGRTSMFDSLSVLSQMFQILSTSFLWEGPRYVFNNAFYTDSGRHECFNKRVVSYLKTSSICQPFNRCPYETKSPLLSFCDRKRTSDSIVENRIKIHQQEAAKINMNSQAICVFNCLLLVFFNLMKA